jgi:hypothetical protein
MVSASRFLNSGEICTNERVIFPMARQGGTQPIAMQEEPDERAASGTACAIGLNRMLSVHYPFASHDEGEEGIP